MRKFDAVLLDMDGTLVDSEKLYDRADELMFEKLGITVTQEERLALVGINLKAGTRLLLDFHPEINMSYEKLCDVYEITITAEDMEPENFNSAEAMLALIDRLQDEF